MDIRRNLQIKINAETLLFPFITHQRCQCSGICREFYSVPKTIESPLLDFLPFFETWNISFLQMIFCAGSMGKINPLFTQWPLPFLLCLRFFFSLEVWKSFPSIFTYFFCLMFGKYHSFRSLISAERPGFNQDVAISVFSRLKVLQYWQSSVTGLFFSKHVNLHFLPFTKSGSSEKRRV